MGPVKRIVFSPDNGDILGLFAYDPIQKKEVVLSAANIKKMVGAIIVADGYDSLSDPKDIIRIDEAFQNYFCAGRYL